MKECHFKETLLKKTRQKEAPFWNETPALIDDVIIEGNTLFAFWKMLARSLSTFSKSAARTASVISQIPSMQFSTDMKVETAEHKVFEIEIKSNFLAIL